jgi:hypothetical protein
MSDNSQQNHVNEKNDAEQSREETLPRGSSWSSSSGESVSEAFRSEQTLKLTERTLSPLSLSLPTSMTESTVHHHRLTRWTKQELMERRPVSLREHGIWSNSIQQKGRGTD